MVDGGKKAEDAALEGAAGAQLPSMDPFQLPERASPCPTAVARHAFLSSACLPALSRIKYDTNAQVATAGAGESNDPVGGDRGGSGDLAVEPDASDDELADEEVVSDLLERKDSDSEVDSDATTTRSSRVRLPTIS